MSPPAYVIEAAREAAMKSPCAKSKRGVALFNRELADRVEAHESVEGFQHWVDRTKGEIAATGYNGQPPPFTCSGSEACRKDCGKLCLHAEERAIRAAGALDDVSDLELVHVKVVDGQVVPGGGPSCWQCSRLVVEVRLRGVWLYEHFTDCPSDMCPLCTGEDCNKCGATAIHATARSRSPERPIDMPVLVGGCEHDGLERHEGFEPPPGVWRFYGAEQFHAATLRHERLGDR